MRRSAQTTRVVTEFLQDQVTWRYGYDLSRATGLQSGTLYPILMRLAERRLLETSWETAGEAAGSGRPPRHLYRLTPDGVRYAREQVSAAAAEDAAKGLAVQTPAFGVGQ